MAIRGKEAYLKFNRLILTLAVMMGADQTFAAEVASKVFPVINYPVKPDVENGAASSKFIALVQNMGRPCDKSESLSWKSSTPSKDIVKWSDRISEKLKATYTVTDLLSALKPINGVDEMLGALSSDGAIITLIWSSAPATVTVTICGNTLATEVERAKMPGGQPTTPGKGPLDVRPPVIDK